MSIARGSRARTGAAVAPAGDGSGALWPALVAAAVLAAALLALRTGRRRRPAAT
jgi:hypothetical protein